MSPDGAVGTPHQARMKGKIGGGDIVYAGMGLNFVDPKGTYDASRYGGISFWAKKNPGSTAHVRLKLPDAQTDPDGKLCKQCFNDHGMELQLYDEWTLYTVPFKSMRQEDWGPKDNGIDPSKVYGIQFQVSEKGAPFDISVDAGPTQIRFTHVGLNPDVECYDVCSSAWSSYMLGSLRDLITTGEGAPYRAGGDFDSERGKHEAVDASAA